jgi:Uma2 family endonuclease
MAEAGVRTPLTAEEYLAFERASEQKHEFANGEVFAMSGGTREHSLIAANVIGELRSALTDRPCEVHTSDLRVKLATGTRYVYPDVSVVCGEPRFEDAQRDTLLNPSVVVEVLSDSSEAYDRGDKFALYRALPSLRDYLLLSQKAMLVEHFHREDDGSWRLRALGPGNVLALPSIDAHVAVERLYLKVALGAAESDSATNTPR